MPSTETADQRLVWDLPVRIIHWSLVLCVLGSWITHELPGDWFAWHVRCGYAVLVLVTTRLLWGLVGTRHALFAGFLRGPAAVLRYARSLFTARPERYAGHNPLGALMVLLLLALLLAQALTGLFANDEILNTGPLYGYVSNDTSLKLTSWHHLIFDLIEVAVLLHVAAALFYLFAKKENLIRPMFTGRKRADEVPADQAIAGSRTWLALLLAVLLGAALWYVVKTAPSADVMGF